MKKIFVLTCALLVAALSFGFSPRTIDEKLLHAFNSSFPRAEKVSWQEEAQVYIVSFVDNGIRSRVTYRKDRTITSYVRYYFEENLPLNIRLALQKDYPGKKVWGVVEISALPDLEDPDADKNLKTSWYVKLESPTHWMTVKVEANGSNTITERYRKAN
ncbi:MAG: hypothetical protein JST39_18460 [Bacteroidetes bacterium]|nr:hypothetical protein [Bacteroidota bacterium]